MLEPMGFELVGQVIPTLCSAHQAKRCVSFVLVGCFLPRRVVSDLRSFCSAARDLIASVIVAYCDCGAVCVFMVFWESRGLL